MTDIVICVENLGKMFRRSDVLTFKRSNVPTFHPELTGRENIYLNGVILGMKREEKFSDTPVKHYSSRGGWQ